jgi:hypothetical protein
MHDDLMEFLETKEPLGFESRPTYSPDGDFLTFYFRADEAYAERVDELLTVFRAIDSHELVGCKVKGVRRIVQTIRNFGVTIRPEWGHPLSLLFMSAACGKPPELQKYYEEMGRYTSAVPFDVSELELV